MQGFCLSVRSHGTLLFLQEYQSSQKKKKLILSMKYN